MPGIHGTPQGSAGVTGPGLTGTSTYNLTTPSASAPSSIDQTLLDMSNIFAPYTVRENGKMVQRRVVMSGAALIAMARDDQTQLYYRKGPDGTVQLVPWKPRHAGRHRAERVGGPQFAVNRVERLQALATLQHYLAGSGIAPGYSPVYGAWGQNDQTVLEDTVQYLAQVGAVRPSQRPLPPAARPGKGKGVQAAQAGTQKVDVLEFGRWLKESTDRQRLDALDQRRIAMQSYGGGGQVVSLYGQKTTDSALDAQFKDLLGRNATADEKARFFAAFRRDEAASKMAEARASQRNAEANAMASVDPATRKLLEDQTKFDQYQVDPVIRVGGQLMHASDAPRSEWPALAQRYGINFAAIQQYYQQHPKTTGGPTSMGGGITTVESPDLGASALEAAKATPDYLPTQVGRAGQFFQRMLSGEYGMRNVQSG